MKKQTSAAAETYIKSRQTTDFSGKSLYVGIDVHLQDWQIAIIHEGIVLGNHRMEGKAEKLIAHLRRHYEGAIFHCVYESSAWGFTLQRQLSAEGMNCIVIHAADVGSSDKEKRRKTDKVDALKLARNHWQGALKAIHVPEEGLQKQRNLIRLRKKLVGDLTRSRNRLKSLLKYQGLSIPVQFGKARWSRDFLHWIEQAASRDPALGVTMDLMLEQIKLLRLLLLKVEKKLREMMQDPCYKEKLELLLTVPGVGRTIAMVWLLEVGDVHRFRSFDELNDFVGLCPDTADSGNTERDRGLSIRQHKQLRSALIEAAWQAIRIDPALLESYQKLTQRMKGNEAIIRIARKLLRRIRTIVLTGIAYQKGVVA